MRGVTAGRFCLLLHKEGVALWGSKFDETVREVWMMIEEYIRIRYDKDCTNLRSAPCYDFRVIRKLSMKTPVCVLIEERQYQTF